MHEAVLVNTAGGITGGDRYDYQCEAAASRVVVTTQAAERAYRSSTDDIAGMDVRLAARRGAALHWLPQETIFFDGADVRMEHEVTLAADAAYLGAEIPLLRPYRVGRNLRYRCRSASAPASAVAASWCGSSRAACRPRRVPCKAPWHWTGRPSAAP